MEPAKSQFFWSRPSIQYQYLGEHLRNVHYQYLGVVLFFFLIAKVQIEMLKSEGMRQKVQQIDRWPPFEKLPEELQNKVKRHQSSNWRESRGVDVEYLVNNDFREEIKQKLCLDILKKVEEFRNWSDTELKNFCSVVKLVVFTERSDIVREGDTIDQMLFVLQGKLWTYSRSIAGSSSTPRRINNQLKDGDFSGEELVAWAKAGCDSSNLPISQLGRFKYLQMLKPLFLWHMI